jgi:hypothetical protein
VGQVPENVSEDAWTFFLPEPATAAPAHSSLLLDHRRATGIEATTASSFVLLRCALDSQGVTMVLSGVDASVQ